MIKLLLLPLIIFIGLVLSVTDFPAEERDYTGITEHCVPDIAYGATNIPEMYLGKGARESGKRVIKRKSGLKEEKL